MERFQRAKLERQVGDVRRELERWVSYYRTIVANNDRWKYDQRYVQLAEERIIYLGELVELAQALEWRLDKVSVP